MTNAGRSQLSQAGEIIPVPFPDFNAWEFLETLESLLNDEWMTRTSLKRKKADKFLEFGRAKGTSPQTAWQKVAVDDEVMELENEYEEACVALRFHEESLKFIYKGLWQYGVDEGEQTKDETE